MESNMAQHVPIHQFEQKKIKKIEESIRKQRYFSASLKYTKLTKDYNETEDDEVYITYRQVPETIVAGGFADFEVHTKPSKISIYYRTPTNIYLVA